MAFSVLDSALLQQPFFIPPGDEQLRNSLQDEEGAKQRAVAAAMHSAVGRASAALGESRQKLGAVRYANIDVKQIVGITQIQPSQLSQLVTVQSVEILPTSENRVAPSAPTPPPFPTVTPEKITVSATVQCAFQIQ